MNAYLFSGGLSCFGCDKSPATIFGRQISAAKFVKWNYVPCSFLSFEFLATTSEQIKYSVSSHKYPFKRPSKDMRNLRTAFSGFLRFFLVWCPCLISVLCSQLYSHSCRNGFASYLCPAKFLCSAQLWRKYCFVFRPCMSLRLNA